MLSQMKSSTTGKLEGKRAKELMSSSSLTGMSQLSNSSEEALEPLDETHKSEPSESTTKDTDPQSNEWLLNGPSGNKTPILRFKCSALATPPENAPAKQLHMTYKIFQTDTKLINLLLQSHGFNEVPMNESNFNILWMGNHPKPDILRNLTPYQKVNHFPRSYEITRKDRLYKNIEAMQRSKGLRNLDFIPQTFLLPSESRELLTAHFRYRGPWIVKPKASSRGRGIYIVNSPEKILTDESVIVAQYINNPLLVDGHKCDLRLYVAVTNYDPLLIYLYEEGLVRFATVKYDGGSQYVWNPCMHLCNYSINKFHVDYVKSEDPDAEDVGHKWTLSALLRHLRSLGQDTELLMQRIEDIIIKSILATASGIVSGIKQFVKHPETCFELFGFDILIDDTLKPWLLEVNLTPSLGCDSPLDVRIKSALMSDLLTLVGIPAVDPILRPQTMQANRPSASNCTKKAASCRRVHSAETLSQRKKNTSKSSGNKSGLTPEQQRIVNSAKAQYERRGGFVRIFPSPKSWEMYSQYLDPTTGIPVVSDPLGPGRIPQQVNTNYNLMLHEQLFPAASRTTGFIIPEVTLDRLSRYERYERALVKGHKQSLDRGDSKENMDVDTHKYKSQVVQSMHDGNKLTPGEARKAFGLYLGYVLRKISQPNADPACCDLVMKFLQQSSSNLRTPFLFTLPSSKLSDKDRAAITAKQLSDFLHLYNRETDLYADTVDRPRTVPNRLFQKFLAAASDITGMASSSVSQEDFDNEFELPSRRNKVRTARSRVGASRTADTASITLQKTPPDVEEFQGACDSSSNNVHSVEHEVQKPIGRKQEKRVPGRVCSVVSCLHRQTHQSKGKQQRDRRKLREKRRSTGVVHLPSTESTGGSTGEDDEELSGTCLETKHNTHHNEFLDHELIEERTAKIFTQRRNKRRYRTSYRSCTNRHSCHSDLEADDEEFDSLNQSDSVTQSDHGNHEPQSSVTTGLLRLPTPTGDNLHELIERAQEENRRLLSLLEDRDHKIMALEARLLQQQREMALERDQLREENAALIRAMAALASN